MVAISQRTFSNTYFLMKFIAFLFEFHGNIFSVVQLPICQHWLRRWLGAEQVTSVGLVYWHKCWPSLLTHICIISLNGLRALGNSQTILFFLEGLMPGCHRSNNLLKTTHLFARINLQMMFIFFKWCKYVCMLCMRETYFLMLFVQKRNFFWFLIKYWSDIL